MIYKNAKVFGEDFKFRIRDIAVQEGRFCEESADGNEVDCTGLMMLPGLVDIHTHGAAGYDNMDLEYEAVNGTSRFMGENGVTTYLPTIMTQSPEKMFSAVKNIAEAKNKGVCGAKIGGIYMEGPYFSDKYKGAQPGPYIRNPDIAEFSKINEAAGNLIRIVSLAPELDGAEEFIAEVSKTCRVSIGHTDADYDMAKKAIELGASNLTHTYNGMRGLHHRMPNAIGAAIDSDITCECICDGMHIHPAMVRLLYRAVGAERLVFVSDSLRAAGMPDGEYRDSGGQQTFVRNGHITLADGTIAGSSATLFGCVKKAVEFGIPLEDAVRAASFNPAKAAGIEDRAGTISVGRAADFILVDENLNLVKVCIDAKIIK